VRLPSRRLLTVAAVVIAAAGLAAALLVVTDDDPQPRSAAGQEDARRACRIVADIERRVVANAAAQSIMADLERAEDLARDAAQADPAWIPLSGGVSALRIAFQEDSARSARTGIDVVRSECRQLGT
jgi:hypothetical protein